MADHVIPFPDPPTSSDPATVAQWHESADALIVAEAIAGLVFGCRVSSLSPRDAAVCRMAGILGLRSVQSRWTSIARQHAIDCIRYLFDQQRVDAIAATSTLGRATVCTDVVLSAYHDLMEGSIVLPPDLYLSIIGTDR